MSDLEIAWVAGLLEGEGSFMVWPTKAGRTNVVRIQMGTSDLDVLERLASVIGVGRVRPIPPQHNKLGTKPMWLWSIQGRADVRELAQRLRPWLGERRRSQVDAILAATDGLVVRPVGICANGHQISGANRVRTGPTTFACRACANARRRERAAAKRTAH